MTNATSRSSSTPAPLRHTGAGEPLLLLHGFALTWESWGTVIDDLATEFEVLAPTLAGHWGGPPLRSPVAFSALIDAAEQAMDDAGWTTAHIAGNSLGGWLALELAKRGRARSVTGVAPAGIWREGSQAAVILRRKFSYLGHLAPVGYLCRYRVLAPVTRNSILPVLAHRPELVPTDLAERTLQAPFHCLHFRELLEVPELPLGFSGFDRITVPTTILFCERDRVIPPQYYGERVIADLPVIDSRTMPGVGHVPMLEAPSLVASEIRNSIRSASNGEKAGEVVI